MKHFTLYLKDGSRKVIEANAEEKVEHAVSRVLNGMLMAQVYFYSEGITDKYTFCNKFKYWVKKPFTVKRKATSTETTNGN